MKAYLDFMRVEEKQRKRALRALELASERLTAYEWTHLPAEEIVWRQLRTANGPRKGLCRDLVDDLVESGAWVPPTWVVLHSRGPAL